MMSSYKKEKEQNFENLIRNAGACTRCPRMSGSIHVVGFASGALNSPVLIIGEAPGRLGADVSAIPFHGDKAGENFEALLEQAGLSRHDCFITNAVLCNPKDDKGNNSTPTRGELQNCSGFLKQQIDLVDPAIVATLGLKALEALSYIEYHEIELANGVRKKWNWYGRILIPLYHPGQRAMVHRSFFNQLADYQFVAETHRKLSKRVKSNAQPTSRSISEVARQILSVCGPVSYFALHKLFYLLEYEHYRVARCRMTKSYIIRQKDGPYVVELNIKKLKKSLPELRTWNEGDRLMLSLKAEPSLFSELNKQALSAVIDPTFLKHVCVKYAARSDEELKRLVYLTTPMRRILRREKYGGENLFNVPIDFSVNEGSLPPRSPIL